MGGKKSKGLNFNSLHLNLSLANAQNPTVCNQWESQPSLEIGANNAPCIRKNSKYLEGSLSTPYKKQLL